MKTPAERMTDEQLDRIVGDMNRIGREAVEAVQRGNGMSFWDWMEKLEANAGPSFTSGGEGRSFWEWAEELEICPGCGLKDCDHRD